MELMFLVKKSSSNASIKKEPSDVYGYTSDESSSSDDESTSDEEEDEERDEELSQLFDESDSESTGSFEVWIIYGLCTIVCNDAELLQIEWYSIVHVGWMI